MQSTELKHFGIEYKIGRKAERSVTRFAESAEQARESFEAVLAEEHPEYAEEQRRILNVYELDGGEQEAVEAGWSPENPPAYTMSKSQYQARSGVHQPMICEISPMQYQGLSKRARREYDAKREREWNASAEIKQAYTREVIAAYDAGEIDADTPGIHADAKSAILSERVRRSKQEAEERYEAARRENEIRSADELKIGDRVHSLMVGYGEVVKINQKSVRIQSERGGHMQDRTIKCGIGELQWLHASDLRAEVEAGEP